jgi:hypothetical protein
VRFFILTQINWARRELTHDLSPQPAATEAKMRKSRSEIANLVVKEACALLANGWVSRETTVTAFRALGERLGYEVASHGGDATHGEWLYDMCWFENRDGFFISQPLVLETEQRPDMRLDQDFHKLVQARAEVRVWIANHSSKKQSVADHVAIYKQQIKRFAATSPDDTCIFMICDGKDHPPFIELFAASDIKLRE